MNLTYHYLIFSQKEFYKNQVIEEILRERTTYYISKNRLIDFWILNSPNWLFENKFFNKIKNSYFYKKHINDTKFTNFSVLISTDFEFIKWIKLRIGDFEDINLSKNYQNYTLNGIYGSIDSNYNILFSDKNKIDKDVLLNQYNYLLKNYKSN